MPNTVVMVAMLLDMRVFSG